MAVVMMVAAEVRLVGIHHVLLIELADFVPNDGSAEEAGGAGPRWMLSSQRSRSFSPLSRSIRRSFSCRVSHSW